MSPEKKLISYFRANTHAKNDRIDTPGFAVGNSRKNTIDYTNTPETKDTSTKSITNESKTNAIRYNKIYISRKLNDRALFIPLATRQQNQRTETEQSVLPDDDIVDSHPLHTQSRENSVHHNSIMSRHRRVESVMNYQEPFDLNRRDAIVSGANHTKNGKFNLTRRKMRDGKVTAMIKSRLPQCFEPI